MLVKFWGVHGSLPRPGPNTLKYGGNTPCVEVICGESLIIFDAGSGIRDLGEDLLRRNLNLVGRKKIKGHIFFSHLHWDHIQGFPFFAPVFIEGNEFSLYGAQKLNCSMHQIMRNQMSNPNFPVELDGLACQLSFHDIRHGDLLKVGDTQVRVFELNHPGGSFGFRVEHGGKVVIYATDTDLVQNVDDQLLDITRNADLFISDSMFTGDQYWGISDNLSRESWGHSTWEAAVQIAKKAGIKKLILFHHGNEDTIVDKIQECARREFPNTIAAYEGLEINL